MNCPSEELTFSDLFGALRRRWKRFLLCFLAVTLLGSIVGWFYAAGHTVETQCYADPLPIRDFDVSPSTLQAHFADYRDSMSLYNALSLRYLYVLSKEESLTAQQQERADALLSQMQTLQTELSSITTAAEFQPLPAKQQALCEALNTFASSVAKENLLRIRLEATNVFSLQTSDSSFFVSPASRDYLLFLPQTDTATKGNTLFRVLITHSYTEQSRADIFLSLALFSALTGLCAGAFFAVSYDVRARRALSARNTEQEGGRA